MPTHSEPGAQPARIATSVIERAFELARTCSSIEEIRRLLREEGYAQVDAHLGGRMIRGQLRALLRSAPAATPDKNPAA